MTDRWLVRARIFVVIAFVAVVGRAYQPQYGFTRFIRFQANGQDRDLLPAVKAVPHAETSAGYDGQFYAQLALEPLVRNPDMDRVLDGPQYRSRRILFSWTAYWLGIGRPAWILQVYAVQNVVTWLLFAWLMARVIPQRGARAFVLWCGCVLAHGVLTSVWMALTDGPATLLIVVAIVAFESGQPIVSALVLGLAGLARETSILAASLFAAALRRQPRSWVLIAGCVLLCVVPLALWMDYLRSLYHSNVLSAGTDHITPPFSGWWWKLDAVARAASAEGWAGIAFRDGTTLAGLTVQAGVTVWALIRWGWRSPWALVAGAFLVLIILAKPAVWDGSPGAFTRVVLPMTVGVNVLLSRRPNAPWWVIVTANLGVLPGVAGLMS